MKTYNYENFNFKTLDGDELKIVCFGYDTGKSWGHKAVILNNDMQVKIVYYNRTWERFKYESVLYKAVEAFYPYAKQKAEKAVIYKQLKAIADNKSAEAQAWLNCFKKAYDALSDETKNTIKKSDVFITSIEQGDALIKTAQLIDALKA